MSRIPIYQMTFGQSSNGKQGLVFTSEQKDYTNQSILFTLPIREQFHDPFDFIEFLSHETIYFPFLLGEKYFDLVAKINFPELIFQVPETDIQVIFEIENGDFLSWPFFPYRRNFFRKTKYVGSEEKFIIKNRGFLNVMPVDLYEKDELFNTHKGVFVGLTPNFGTFDSENYKQ